MTATPGWLEVKRDIHSTVRSGRGWSLATLALVLLAGCAEDTGSPEGVSSAVAGSSSPSLAASTSNSTVELGALAIGVSNLTDDGATISWAVSGPASVSSRLEYGRNALYGSVTPYQAALGAKKAGLTGLQANREYHYRIHLVAGTLTWDSPDATFRTLSGLDTEPPVITNVDVRQITQNSSRIDWSVTENSGEVTSLVEYGLDATVLDSRSENLTGEASQSIMLSDLAPGTRYYFRVYAVDEAGNVARSAPNSFTTLGLPDVADPVLSQIAASGLAPTAATISWNVTDASGVDTYARYGNATGSYPTTSETRTGSGAKSVRLTGLTHDTRYFFVVLARDAAGNEATSAETDFVTLGQTTTDEPPRVDSVRTSGMTTNSVVIAWNVTEESSNVTSQVCWGAQSHSTCGPFEHAGDEKLGAGAKSQSLSGLNAGTTYYFVIHADDAANPPVDVGPFTFTTAPNPTPSSSPAPVPPDVGATITVAGVRKDSFMVTYTVTGPSGTTSKVEYGTSTSYGSEIVAAAGTGSKTVTILGLAQKTLYHFRVVATASSGTDSSADQTQRTAESMLYTIVANAGTNSYSPATDTAEASGKWHIEVTNTHTVAHTWTIQGQPSGYSTGSIAASGGTDELIVDALSTGVYTYYCTIHTSMTGSLTVS